MRPASTRTNTSQPIRTACVAMVSSCTGSFHAARVAARVPRVSPIRKRCRYGAPKRCTASSGPDRGESRDRRGHQRAGVEVGRGNSAPERGKGPTPWRERRARTGCLPWLVDGWRGDPGGDRCQGSGVLLHCLAVSARGADVKGCVVGAACAAGQGVGLDGPAHGERGAASRALASIGDRPHSGVVGYPEYPRKAGHAATRSAKVAGLTPIPLLASRPGSPVWSRASDSG